MEGKASRRLDESIAIGLMPNSCHCPVHVPCLMSITCME